jgi:hypothetical protein
MCVCAVKRSARRRPRVIAGTTRNFMRKSKADCKVRISLRSSRCSTYRNEAIATGIDKAAPHELARIEFPKV